MRKAFSTRLMAVAMVLATVLSLASCSDSPADLINFVPNDTKAVLTFKPKDIAKKGNMEKYLKMVPNKDSNKKAIAFAKQCSNGESGIDLEQMVVFEYENNAYISFIINDIDKFSELNLIKDNTTKGKTDGFVTFEGDDKKIPNIVVDGKAAWLSSGDLSDLTDAVKTFTSLDKDKSVAAVNGFKDNMADGDLNIYINLEEVMSMAGGASEQMINKELSRYGISADDAHLKDYMDSRVYMNWIFDKDKLTINSKMVDSEGNNLLDKFAGNLSIDTEILKYFDKNTSLVYATVLPDYVKKMYAKMIEGNIYDEAQKAVITTLFNNLDDNVGIGITLSGNLQKTVESEWGTDTTFNNKAVTATVVAKCKKNLENDVKSLAAMAGLPVAANGSVTVPVDADINLTIKADGNYLVLTNGAIATQPLTDPGLFKGRSAAMLINLSKNSLASQSILNTYGIDLDLTVISFSDKKDNKIEVKVNNNKKDNVLEYFIDLIYIATTADQA